MLHQRSFYITLGIIVLFYGLLLTSDGFVSNGPFASFDRIHDSVTAFLYFMPKSTVFMIGIFVYGALLFAQTYTSKQSASIYPLQVHRSVILFAQWIMSLLIYAIFSIAIILVSLLASFFIPNEFGNLDVFSYLFYWILQGMMIATLMMGVLVLVHLLRTTTVAILFACMLGTGIIFMLVGMVVGFLHLDTQILSYTLYYTAGNLPYVFDVQEYGMACLRILAYIGVYASMSTYLLHQKDLA